MTRRTRLMPAMGAVAAVAAIAAAPAVAQHSSKMPATPKQNIVQVASSNPQFSTLVSLIKEAGLVKTLSGRARSRSSRRPTRPSPRSPRTS